MKIDIQSEDIESTRVRQILKFYLSRLQQEISSLRIKLEQLKGNQTHYCVSLNVQLTDGTQLEFSENQSILLTATQRVLDRLVRHLQLKQRRQQHASQW